MTALLLVEDEPLQQDTLSRRLERKFHFTVDIAGNGQEALEKLGSNTYDLVLMDIGLPDIDGIEVVKRFRNQRPSSEVPIFALTAQLVDEKAIESLKQKGFNEYFVKPLDYKAFEAKLCEYQLHSPAPKA